MKTMQDKEWFLKITNRKSHITNRVVLFPMTLSKLFKYNFLNSCWRLGQLISQTIYRRPN